MKYSPTRESVGALESILASTLPILVLDCSSTAWGSSTVPPSLALSSSSSLGCCCYCYG